MNDYHLTVRFEGTGISLDEQGPLLLHLEREARKFTGKYIEVFKGIMADDSKLRTKTNEKRRRDMSQKEREAL